MISFILSIIAAIVFLVPLIYGVLILEFLRQRVVELGEIFGPLPTGACIVGYFALLDMLVHGRDRAYYCSFLV